MTKVILMIPVVIVKRNVLDIVEQNQNHQMRRKVVVQNIDQNQKKKMLIKHQLNQKMVQHPQNKKIMVMKIKNRLVKIPTMKTNQNIQMMEVLKTKMCVEFFFTLFMFLCMH
jgi:glucosamine 6-phosphate synthetase-like amidotransferase/phosphosugar isomerase protein